tara:strand:- start:396 stop:1520 length:1125 start_codon:yes stop_codon:yes gene_type:complete
MTAQKLGCKSVGFLSKKKALGSIQSDFDLLNPDYEFKLINYESIHKIDFSDIDMLVIDESHSISSFPKPSKWAKQCREIVSKNPSMLVLHLSGTLTPESYSQIYHQYFVSPHSPFWKYQNFYKWAAVYTDTTKKKRVGSFFVRDYSFAFEDLIDKALEGRVLSYTQEQAGFKSKVVEDIHYVNQDVSTLKMIKRLKKDKIIEGKDDVIIADSGAKMQQKMHQMFSGTIKLDSGKRIILNRNKIDYIYKTFKNKRLAIIYNFVAESQAIKEKFGDTITGDLEEFQASDTLHFMGQIMSTKEGTNLSKADLLIMYNIAFSATAYFQIRARLSTIDRPETLLKWIFSRGGIEDDIYRAVAKKKDYTLSYFRKYLKEI